MLKEIFIGKDAVAAQCEVMQATRRVDDGHGRGLPQRLARTALMLGVAIGVGRRIGSSALWTPSRRNGWRTSFLRAR